MKFAIYASRELRTQYYNGTGFVVREELYPHTTRQDGQQVTKQGAEIRVGMRKGYGHDDSGLTVTKFTRPDSAPFRDYPDGN